MQNSAIGDLVGVRFGTAAYDICAFATTDQQCARTRSESHAPPRRVARGSATVSRAATVEVF